MLATGQHCNRKQLILKTNVLREKKNSFGPSSEQIPPTQTTACRRQGDSFMEKMRVVGHVPSICLTDRGLWMFPLMLLHSFPVTLAESVRADKREHRRKCGFATENSNLTPTNMLF